MTSLKEEKKNKVYSVVEFTAPTLENSSWVYSHECGVSLDKDDLCVADINTETFAKLEDAQRECLLLNLVDIATLDYDGEEVPEYVNVVKLAMALDEEKVTEETIKSKMGKQLMDTLYHASVGVLMHAAMRPFTVWKVVEQIVK